MDNYIVKSLFQKHINNKTFIQGTHTYSEISGQGTNINSEISGQRIELCNDTYDHETSM